MKLERRYSDYAVIVAASELCEGGVTADGAGSTQKSDDGPCWPMAPFKGYLHWKPTVHTEESEAPSVLVRQNDCPQF